MAGKVTTKTRTQSTVPAQWLEANRPLGPTTLRMKGLHADIPAKATEAAEGWLDQHRTRLNSEHLVHHPGAEWKRCFAPQTAQLEWRIEIKSYSCSH
jgi:hypothetical protein